LGRDADTVNPDAIRLGRIGDGWAGDA
jgi:hypothetical protein